MKALCILTAASEETTSLLPSVGVLCTPVLHTHCIASELCLLVCLCLNPMISLGISAPPVFGLVCGTKELLRGFPFMNVRNLKEEGRRLHWIGVRGGGRQVVPGMALSQSGLRGQKSCPQPGKLYLACRLFQAGKGGKKLQKSNGARNSGGQMERGGRSWHSDQRAALEGQDQRFKAETWWEGAQGLFLNGEVWL